MAESPAIIDPYSVIQRNNFGFTRSYGMHVSTKGTIPRTSMRTLIHIFLALSLLISPTVISAQDANAVVNFVQELPPTIEDYRSQSGCEIDARAIKTDLVFEDEGILVTRTTDVSRSGCPNLPNLSGVETLTCGAQLAELDSSLEIWSGPSVRLCCKSNDDCFDCKMSYQAQLEGFPDLTEEREYNINYSHIPLASAQHFFGDSLFPSNDQTEPLDDFVEAFSTLISSRSSSTSSSVNELSYCN